MAYPLLIHLGMGRTGSRAVALCLAAAVLARAFLPPSRAPRSARGRVSAPAAAVAVLAVGSVALGEDWLLLLLPTLVNLVLLVAFGRTLVAAGQPSMVETIARLQVGELSDAEVRYCRTVTWVWCGFFVCNGVVAGWLAFAASLRSWALYTGMVSYVLVALLFACELCYRYWRFRRYAGAVTDPLFRWIFPPR